MRTSRISQPQVSWTEHNLHIPENRRKRSHHQIKKRRSSRFDERWKRSGAMTSHHGCDEHYKRRTCPGCQGDEYRRCGSCHGDYYRMSEEKVKTLPYVRFSIEILEQNPEISNPEKKVQYIDKDLGIVYYERDIPNVKIIAPSEEPVIEIWKFVIKCVNDNTAGNLRKKCEKLIKKAQDGNLDALKDLKPFLGKKHRPYYLSLLKHVRKIHSEKTLNKEKKPRICINNVNRLAGLDERYESDADEIEEVENSDDLSEEKGEERCEAKEGNEEERPPIETDDENDGLYEAYLGLDWQK